MDGTKNEASAKVEYAVAGVQRALDRLVVLLGDEDPEVVTRVGFAVADLGPVAVDALARALPRAGTQAAAAALIGALAHFGLRKTPEVTGALLRASTKARDPAVRRLAACYLDQLRSAAFVRDVDARVGRRVEPTGNPPGSPVVT